MMFCRPDAKHLYERAQAADSADRPIHVGVVGMSTKLHEEYIIAGILLCPSPCRTSLNIRHIEIASAQYAKHIVQSANAIGDGDHHCRLIDARR